MANTQQTEKKQSAKQKKILVASILLAAAITVGSTFAWFTSKDEVTNRLTASANYGVSITETFTPPEDWVPGQTINKDVGAVNTGNVDAFVKLTISNEMILTHETASAASFDADKAIELSHSAGSSTNEAGITKYYADEVTAIEAGSVLAYTSSTEQADKDQVGNIVVDNTLDSSGNPINATGEFTPTGTGVYVFRRHVQNEAATNSKVLSNFVYAGYYYNSDNSKYYAINIEGVNYDESATTNTVDKDGIFLTGEAPTITYRQKETVVVTPDLKLSNDKTKIIATYSGTTDTADDIVIDINLATDYAKDWTADGDTEFYLNEILKAGATSPDLIDSVKLSDATTSKAYLNFDYDLKIALDSAQVTYNDSGNATAEAVTADTTTWKLTPTVTYNDVTNKVTWKL